MRVQHVAGYYQGDCGVNLSTMHITASLHGNSHLADSGATVCVCMCAEYSISVLGFSAWCGVISLLHICGNVSSRRRRCTIKTWHFSFMWPVIKTENIVKAMLLSHSRRSRCLQTSQVPVSYEMRSDWADVPFRNFTYTSIICGLIRLDLLTIKSPLSRR